MNIKSRFAPSPTSTPDENGKYRGLHLGGAKTALHSYLWSKSQGGSYVLRSEDSDPLRSSKGSEKAILDSLEWLGLVSEEPIVRQSERNHIYQEYLDKLLASGHCYRCYCEQSVLESKREAQKAAGKKPLYDRTCLGAPEQPEKPYVVRFHVPSFGRVKINDKILGRILLHNAELSDPILQRSDKSFTFLFVNIIDDVLQKISLVLRGQEGISHLHSQSLICEALGLEMPEYAHVPYVLGSDMQKLSKRNGAKGILELKEEGYLPEAVLNCLARLGASYGSSGTKEILSMAELVDLFEIRNVSKSPAMYDPDKLKFLNFHWIKAGDPERLSTLLKPFLLKLNISEEEFNKVNTIKAISTLQTRSKTLVEMAEKALFYYKSDFSREPLSDTHKEWLSQLLTSLKLLDDFGITELESEVNTMLKLYNITLKDLGPVIRKALTGSLCSPPVVDVMNVLGKEETVRRLERAIAI